MINTSLSPLQRILEALYHDLKSNDAGEVASYIPELGKADPKSFGICLVTADGQVYQVGDCEKEFTIQSISKPFVYGIALEDKGKAAVLNKIWMEPSGEAFNAISLRPDSGKPENPMINAGAITATSLVDGEGTQGKIDRIVDVLGRHAGRALSIDHSVYESESSTGHRNRAISYMLRNFDIFEEDPQASLEAYFMQCSISVNCYDLGMMAATLANGGINPKTGEVAVDREYVQNILSVMGSCGMYDAAGEWIYNVGMPAKSGVAGGIVAVLPGQLGIGVFSPPLDACGNSVRGIEVCREISRKFDLHMFQVPQLTTSVLRRVGSLTHTRSSRLRSEGEMQALRENGESVRVIELQGDLMFGTAEFACREFTKTDADIREIIMDFSHVTGINASAARLFAEAFSTWLDSGHRISICRCERYPLLQEMIRSELPEEWQQVAFYNDMPEAFEEAENSLLDDLGLRRHSSEPVTLAQCQLLQGVSAEGLETIQQLLIPKQFAKGQIVMKEGDPSDGMFFIIRGKASAYMTTEVGLKRRLGTFSPGMNFGEMGLLNQNPRTADILADSEMEALKLTTEAFEQLEQVQPELRSAILKKLCQIIADRLSEANAELAQMYR